MKYKTGYFGIAAKLASMVITQTYPGYLSATVFVILLVISDALILRLCGTTQSKITLV